MSFERRADAERDHGNARGVANADDRGDFLVRMGKHDDVGQRRVGQAFAVRMLFADGARCHRAVAVFVAKLFGQRRHLIGRGPGAQDGRGHSSPFFQKRGSSGCGSSP